MASADLGEVERRAVRAFEHAVLRRAALGLVPMLAAAAVAILLAREPLRTLWVALVVVLACGVAFWWRRGMESAAAVGFFAGLVPYTASIVASRWGGHVCTPGGCTSMCLPACAVGGVIAAVFVARSAARRGAGLSFWVPASAMTVATGALGCSCAGYAGATGLLVGYGLAIVPAAIAARWRRS